MTSSITVAGPLQTPVEAPALITFIAGAFRGAASPAGGSAAD